MRDNDQASLNVDLLEPYIDMLIATKKTESLMFTLDRMKEYIDSNKFKIIPTLTSKENTLKEEAHQTHLENLTKSLFKNFLNKLLSKDLKTESSLVYNEISKRGWIESTRDYINGLKISTENPENFVSIMEEFIKKKSKEHYKVTLEDVLEILEAVRSNETELMKYVPSIIDNFFGGENLAYEEKSIQAIANLCFHNKEYGTFRKLLDGKFFLG